MNESNNGSNNGSKNGDTSLNIFEQNCVVEFPNGTKKMFPRYTPLIKILEDKEIQNSWHLARDHENRSIPITEASNIVAARVNNLVTNFNNVIQFGKAKVEPVYEKCVTGHRIIRHTLIFLFSMACQHEFPDNHFTVEHHMGNGYFCEMNAGQYKVSQEMVEKIENRIKKIVNQNMEIKGYVQSNEEAIEYFSHVCKRPYVVIALKSNNDPKIKVDRCNGFADIHKNVLAGRTGLLKNSFELVAKRNGIWLKFPKNPYGLHYPFEEEEFIRIYREYNLWGSAHHISCTGELNELIRNKQIKHFMFKLHAYQDLKIYQIANKIFEKKDSVKLTLIAGPSASGKTTFAKKLSVQLEILGFKPIVLSVDDYYKPNVECPLDEHGHPDFETINALRVDLLNEHLSKLLEGKEVETPIFDFKKGRPKDTFRKMKMVSNSVLIMEGIHCLNPQLTHLVDDKNKYKIFIAPFPQLNLDEMNFISSARTRLLRRIVRDYNHRGHSPQVTLKMWTNVRGSEHKYIFPYIKNADFIFNSALDYEYSVIKAYVKPLLNSIHTTDVLYNSARELLSFLDNFMVIPHDDIPSDSLLREFIGHSFFDES